MEAKHLLQRANHSPAANVHELHLAHRVAAAHPCKVSHATQTLENEVLCLTAEVLPVCAAVDLDAFVHVERTGGLALKEQVKRGAMGWMVAGV